MNTKSALRLGLISLLVTSLAFGSVLAQQPISIVSTSTERLRVDITHLASDKLQGRRTGTGGANAAASYIAEHFRQLGLRPGNAATTASSGNSRAKAADYLQPFPYVAGVELGKKNALQLIPKAPAGPVRRASMVEPISFKPGEDWMPLGMSSNGTVEGEMAFVGFGITDAELKYDDYPAATRGRIALAIMGTPDGDNPHGKFARHEQIRWKAIAARNAGAKALLIISRESVLQNDRNSRLRYDNNAGEAGLPVAIISRRAAILLCGETEEYLLGNVENALKSIIAEQLKHESPSYGVSAMPNIKDFPISDDRITLSVDLIRRQVAANNVIGILAGSDPALSSEAIVIGAHYDHLGLGGEGSLAIREGGIHYGADDNASGTAALMELARIFTSRKAPRRTVVFIAFSGEEEGLLGSNYYVNHPVIPIQNTVTMINMDMVGRMKNNKLVIGGVGTAENWRNLIASANGPERLRVTAGNGPHGEMASSAGDRPAAPMVVGANGRTIVSMTFSKPFELTLSEDGFGPSDHSSFYGKKVPVLFLWTGTHEDYHKPSDTADKINYEDEARIINFVSRLVHEIDINDKRPVYAVARSESTGRSTGFRVYLGTIPNYADSNDGLLLDGVREDSPAAKAGLKAGDRIVKLAGRDVKNVYDYTFALGQMKAGQEYEVEVMRDGARVALKITPAERR